MRIAWRDGTCLKLDVTAWLYWLQARVRVWHELEGASAVSAVFVHFSGLCAKICQALRTAAASNAAASQATGRACAWGAH